MASFAFRIPTCSPALSMRKRFATAKPAASSPALLIRRPDDNRVRVCCSPTLVLSNWACAFKDARFVTTEKLIGFLLRESISLPTILCRRFIVPSWFDGPPWTPQALYRASASGTLEDFRKQRLFGSTVALPGSQWESRSA